MNVYKLSVNSLGIIVDLFPVLLYKLEDILVSLSDLPRLPLLALIYRLWGKKNGDANEGSENSIC